MSIGPLMIDLEGTTLSAEECALLQNPLVGGIILFTHNFTDLEQLQRLILSIRNCRPDPVLIAVDHEGGRIQRFHKDFTALPACSRLGECYDLNPSFAVAVTETAGWLMAAELLSVGIDFSFAPVLDLDHGVSTVMKGRTFHRDPLIVFELA